MYRAVPMLLAALIAAHPATLRGEPLPVPPTQTAEAIDRYHSYPRTPETYRALAGIGDPGVGTAQSGYEPIPPRQRRLLAAMLADDRPINEEYWYPQPGMCRTDYALRVAEARADRLGEDHAYVRQWLRVQRAVFTPCRDRDRWQLSPEERTRPGPPIALPGAMATDDPGIAELQRHDRAYQAAALLFYRRDPAAERAFRAIAGSGSPHAPIARYMLAALPARDVESLSYSPDPGAAAAATIQAETALTQAQAILANPRLREVHPLAQGLVGFLGYHTGDPAVRAVQVRTTLDALEAPLARIRADSVTAERYARASADLPWLHGEFADAAWWLNGAVPTAMTASRAMADQARTRSMAAWLLFPQSPYERQPWAAPRNERGDWWLLEERARLEDERETGQAWTILRAGFATAYDPAVWAQVDRLREAALAQPTDQHLAALAGLFYHQIRAAIMYPQIGEDYEPAADQQGFEQALARLEAWPWKQTSHFRDLVSSALAYLAAEGRIAEARMLRDRLRPRGEEYYPTPLPLLLLAENEDQLAAEIAAAPGRGQNLINLMSADALARLAAREDLPPEARARFTRTAWARLYALERPIPRGLDALMRRLNPEVTAGWTSGIGARPSDRRLLLDVLRSPALNVLITPHQRGRADSSLGYSESPGLTGMDTFQHSDNNWWCAWQPERHRLTPSAMMYRIFFAPEEDGEELAAAGASAALRPLLSGSWLWQAQDLEEQAALAAIRSAPQLLAERAIAWRGRGLFGGRAAGQDEALALAVRATRYGCQRQGGHGAWSRAAWELLRQRFPQSDAAARTRWWFDCSHFTGGCDRRRQEEAVTWRRWTGGYED